MTIDERINRLEESHMGPIRRPGTRLERTMADKPMWELNIGPYMGVKRRFVGFTIEEVLVEAEKVLL